MAIAPIVQNRCHPDTLDYSRRGLGFNMAARASIVRISPWHWMKQITGYSSARGDRPSSSFSTPNPASRLRVRHSDDTDDLFFDQENKRVYVSAGEGDIDIISQLELNITCLAPRSRPFRAPARHCLCLDLHRLYLAVPHRGAREAAIRVYE